ncbi:putative hydrolase of the HAD superfamily [Actinopolyspora xinjiangensis]|uniref:Putative hydrolase of the HAD superfamily n=1 Tax=Actinopolyspora xinjiangensis TaxID=405564 RepID=A0A1H0W239_9ACTN|nr:HAD family hydrolase [Actinopolyspora xinjiangensis]SDP84800.1 putative hydrolase of the HAD superfamily [Actinopolyspora xinjiangensis]
MGESLVFDADDTLWENNVLFERAVEAFIDHLAHPELTREQVREQLDEIEKANCRIHGYGVDSFERSLLDCLRHLRDGDVSEADRIELRRACTPIREQRIELIDGVEETLRELSRRHDLYLLTKGDADEQAGKIKASGLSELFADVTVVPEKKTATYERFVAERGLEGSRTWMIGNSPRSDIWPALHAGLNAVLVPHPLTWSLELRELPDPGSGFRTVEPFSRLSEHF